MKQNDLNETNTKVKTIVKEKTNTSHVLIGLFALSMLVLMLVSCTNEEKQKAENSKHKKVEESSNSTEVSDQNSNYEIVPNEKVCMVNDMYMGTSQIAIDVSGITYYGCCENCIEKLQNNMDGVRFGVNPIAANKVDKASATIVQDKKSRSVYYFETKEEANTFISKQ